ncbi:FAD-dependent oxidoreductase [Streptomyces mobaraensis NBRC 13819 = DSM 40847]|uniref:FAD dependent oxidoreductase n=1 Tax=Streptomyces mobaraensis (strain ATCC 29032 / DSM 40847 / JCM 4168 / NBRC 13819 / NCIMB 11159 / IPCR 16-22) TaxID=1223523 RepID=M3A3C5_STRM1|nr:FAD-dependent oxidoreductase [Streptomyces mobaraensis]EME99553.1 FAD dependent oxidoreductase [Streptomyces mobaraensis NBRC 13819 = DSM 40847]QTT73073.1 FAD-dependent oxidoreductase [Streptomyces mobaraensis NBRC 13819 = DSM 40847]
MNAYKHVVYWHDTEPVTPGPPLRETVDCDVCIVGGGFTGLWTAYFLKEAEPALDIRIVEAHHSGYGASGRADGFVTPTIGKDIQALVKEFGEERALEASQAVGRSILEIGRFTRKNKVDAEYEATDYLMVATDAAQLRRLEEDRDLAVRMGAAPPEIMSRDEAMSVVGSPAIAAGMRTGGALVNPFKLARGLARVVREKGVTLYDRTPCLRVEPGVRPVVVTAGGRVKADKVVLATNVHMDAFPPFRRKVVPIWTYAMVSEPLTDAQLARVPWAGREGLVEAKSLLTCARFTHDNRIMFAGGPAPYYWGRDKRQRNMNRPEVYREIHREFLRFFPMWADVEFSYAYGGTADVVRDYAPHFGTLAGGRVLYGYGYCGNGIAATHTGGKVLRDLTLGKDTPHSRLLFVDDGRRRPPASFPPEPALYIGARAATRLMNWKESRP